MICSVTAVSSPSHVQRHSFDWSALLNPLVFLNVFLICLTVVGFAYYIAGINAVTSSEYNISAIRTKISKLTEAQSLLTAEKSATENPAITTAFARAQLMVEAKDVVYVFENNNVALQK